MRSNYSNGIKIGETPVTQQKKNDKVYNDWTFIYGIIYIFDVLRVF